MHGTKPHMLISSEPQIGLTGVLSSGVSWGTFRKTRFTLIALLKG